MQQGRQEQIPLYFGRCLHKLDTCRIREKENAMKIMVQDRTMIVEQPRCVWVEQVPFSDKGAIASNSKRAPILGKYPSMNRAKEVLKEVFEYQRNGRYNFYMPQE